MTLKQYLKKHKGEYVKIGSNRGSAFIYATKITDDTERWFMEKDEYYKKRYLTLRGIESSNLSKVIKREMPRWIMLLNREIVDTFRANPIADEFEPQVVILKGFERGLYWTVEEYYKGKIPEEEEWLESHGSSTDLE